MPVRQFKLYLSPSHEELPSAWRALVAEVDGSRAVSFKIAATPAGTLRPDMCVVYFRRRGDLERLGDRLRRRLQGMRAHGVPFTADLGGDGLLSWGVDPPHGRGRGVAKRELTSWRTWVALRLARSLEVARRRGDRVAERPTFALERLRRDDVDPTTFTPGAELFAASAG